MAKVRTSINPLYTGAAGGYTFYVRKAEQVVRQRKNNSNYGEDASRTVAQQERRVTWANLVNLYKAIKSWQSKAYETKSKGQTDYNVFMSLNVPNAVISLTKNMALNGCAVVAGQYVSRGSLQKIGLTVVSETGYQGFDIELSNDITSTTTVGEFASDVIANNPEFQNGDNLAIITFINEKTAQGYPYARSVYSEITLDTSSTKVLQTITHADRLSKDPRGYLQFEEPSTDTGEVGEVLIHTRKVAGNLLVSTQQIRPNGYAFDNEFSSQPWLEECIESYGVDKDVPLDPSFRLASIQSVTANGSAVSNAQVLEGSQELRVYGTNLNAQTFQLKFNGTLYTPLEIGNGYLGYLLGDNGEVELYLNDRFYIGFSVSDVTRPAGLPTRLQMSQRDVNLSNAINARTLNLGDCINYPFLKDKDHPVFFLYMGSAGHPFTDREDFVGHNCTVGNIAAEGENQVRMAAVVTAGYEGAAYITYKDFIVAVFNYTN